MKEATALIQELAALTGADVALAPDGVAEPLARDVLARALSFNLFGAESLGLHVGLFANALVLSTTCPAAGLTAEAFAERLLFLSAQIDALGRKLVSDADAAPAAAAPADRLYA